MDLPTVNAYLNAMEVAYLAGHYIPEIDVWFHRYDNFSNPIKTTANDFGH